MSGLRWRSKDVMCAGLPRMGTGRLVELAPRGLVFFFVGLVVERMLANVYGGVPTHTTLVDVGPELAGIVSMMEQFTDLAWAHDDGVLIGVPSRSSSMGHECLGAVFFEAMIPLLSLVD